MNEPNPQKPSPLGEVERLTAELEALLPRLGADPKALPWDDIVGAHGEEAHPRTDTQPGP